jgi:hypothetical protein
MNYESQRLTPTFVGFRNTSKFDFFHRDPIVAEEGFKLRPFFGREAVELMIARPYAGTGYLPAFLDVTPDAARRIARALFVNTTAARVSLTDLNTIFWRLYLDCVSHNRQVQTVTVVVPATFTVPQRRLIESAIQGCGFRFLATIDDIDAVANNYALSRTALFAKADRTVLFVDVGATTVKAYCIRFGLIRGEKTRRATADRLSYVLKSEQGGAFVTAKLAELIQAKLGLESPGDSDRRRLFDVAERTKTRLTGLRETTFVIEDLDDQDRTVSVTREELNKLAAELIADVIATAKEALSGITVDDFEVIGGSSRLPQLQADVQAALGFNSTGHSLNADEALALGAGYHAQFHAGKSQYQRVLINDSFPIYTVSAVFGNTSIQVSARGGNVTNEVQTNETVTSVVLAYDPSELGPSLKTHSFGIRVDNMTENQTLQLRLSKTPVNITTIRLCRDGRFCSFVPLVPLVPIFSASPVYLTIMRADYTRKRHGRLVNDVEQLALRVIDELDHNVSVQTFTSEMQRYLLRLTAQTVKQWIFDHTDGAEDEKNLSAKYEEIRELIVPVYQRIAENKTLSQAVALMYQTVQAGRYSLMLEWPINKSWINKSITANFSRLLNQTETWLLETVEKITQVPLWEEKPIKPKDIYTRVEPLLSEYRRISMILPPPKVSWWARAKKSLKSLFGRSSPVKSTKLPPKAKTVRSKKSGPDAQPRPSGTVVPSGPADADGTARVGIDGAAAPDAGPKAGQDEVGRAATNKEVEIGL